MSLNIDPTRRCDRMDLLHPHARGQFEQLAAFLVSAHMDKETKSLFLPFETYRYPQRQRMLKTQSGPAVTRADMYQSPHQFGMAVDFVAYTNNLWSWSETEDWDFLRVSAERFRLTRPMPGDRPHIEHPKWNHLVLDLKDARMW